MLLLGLKQEAGKHYFPVTDRYSESAGRTAIGRQKIIYISLGLIALSVLAAIFLIALEPSAINWTYMLPVLAGGGIGVYLKLSTNKANNSHHGDTEPESKGE